MHNPVLVAYYTSKLDKTSQINIYSNFLEKITMPDQRSLGLKAGEDAKLPIEEITKRIIETYRYIFYFLATMFFNIS